ncbi:MAG: carboxypeptidase-like regulatory domain-containing protein [Nitrospiria bacterium]
MKVKKGHTFFSGIFICFAGAFFVAACSSGGGGGGSPSVPSISGIVSDPAIENAEVVLMNLDGTPAKISDKTGSDGRFTLAEVPPGSLSNYRLITSGGADRETGQEFIGITLCLPLALYQQYDNVVVSPLTCLVDAAFENSDIEAAIARVKTHLGEVDITADPAANPSRMALAMKLTLMAAEGKSFQQMLAGLDTSPGIDVNDLANIFPATEDGAVRSGLSAFFQQIDNALSSGADLPQVYQRELIERAIRKILGDALTTLSDPTDIANAEVNIDTLVAYFMGLKASATRSYLMEADVVATLSGGGGLQISMIVADPSTFDPSIFKLVLVDRSATFSDAAKLAYYRMDNPATGNHQLAVYDGVTGKQTVVKNNVIIGSRAFVLEGTQEGEKTTITAKKYGIFLDPNQAREKRTAPDGRGGSFEYEFFFDNAFKRYEVATPSNEAIIFGSSMLSQGLRDQGIHRLSGQHVLHNNISDPDNSYVDLTAMQRLPDALRGETGDGILQAPVTVRLVDGRMTQGRVLAILKDGSGLTQQVLINFIPVHQPSGSAPAGRLQLCPPDLSGCADVAGGGGNYFFLAENDSHLYLGKQGEATIYAFDRSAHMIDPVIGVAYPAPFDPDHHLAGAGGHGDSSLLSDFSSLSGVNRSLSDGVSAYLGINYDFDRQDPVGAYTFLGNIYVYKHAQVLKLSGTSGVKMYDNGDGVDQGDLSDAEAAKGHINLVAVSNGRLFVEIGNYDGVSAGGACTPSPVGGYNCSSVHYGYINTGSIGKTGLDGQLQAKTGLRYFTSRRIAPVAINNRLTISLLEVQGSRGTPHQYKLHLYDLATVNAVGTSVGRTAMMKSAERSNGVFDGEILAWDAVTGELHNVTRNELVLGNPTVVSGGSPAINSVLGRTDGVPLAGIGSLYALRAHNGDHNWHLLAGVTDASGGLVHVDQVPTSAWLYD